MQVVPKETSLEVVALDPKDYGLEPEKAVSIVSSFEPKIIERNALAKVYQAIIEGEMSLELAEKAGALRRKLVPCRTGMDKIHKVEKAYYLAASKFIDAKRRKEVLPITQMEEVLSGMETHYIKLEEAKIEKLHTDRLEEVTKFGFDAGYMKFGEMAQASYDVFLKGLETSYFEKKAEEEAAELAAKELKRKQDVLSARNIEIAPYRLLVDITGLHLETTDSEYFDLFEKAQDVKIVADKKSAEQEAENERLKAAKVKSDAEAKAKQDKVDAENKRLKDEADAAKAKAAAAQKVIDDAKAAKIKEESDAKAAALAEANTMTQAADKDKLKIWLTSAKIDKIPLEISTGKNSNIAELIEKRFHGFKAWALSEIEKID